MVDILNHQTLTTLSRSTSTYIHSLAIVMAFGYGLLHIFNGIPLIGYAAFLSGACLLIGLNNIMSGSPNAWLYLAFFSLQGLALTLTSFYFGIRGLILIQPIAAGMFFVLSVRVASAFAIGISIIALYMAHHSTPPDLYIRIAAAIIVSVSLSGSFAYILSQQNKKFHTDSKYDQLTKILNRRGFEECLGRALHKCRDENSDLVLYFIDLDNFKAINDNFGHAAGDQVLVSFTKRIHNSIRTSDKDGASSSEHNIFARLSGDEFVLVIPKIDSNVDALNILYRLREASDGDYRFDFAKNPLHLSASIGFSFASKARYDLDNLIKTADEYMYQDKNHKKHAGV